VIRRLHNGLTLAEERGPAAAPDSPAWEPGPTLVAESDSAAAVEEDWPDAALDPNQGEALGQVGVFDHLAACAMAHVDQNDS